MDLRRAAPRRPAGDSLFVGLRVTRKREPVFQQTSIGKLPISSEGMRLMDSVLEKSVAEVRRLRKAETQA